MIPSVRRPSAAKTGLASLAAVCLASCAATTGAPPMQPPVTSIPQMSAPQRAAALQSSDVDRQVAALYEIAPRLRLPARFALAKSEHGRLVAPPETEIAEWTALAGRLGPSFGEFVVLTPMIAQSAADLTQTATRDAVADIRRGSALLKADYALVYEVATASETRDNALSAADWTLIGLWLAPSRSVTGDALAEAVLLDVRTGLPLGSARAQADTELRARPTTADQRRQAAAEAAGAEAVALLARDVETLTEKLIAEAAADARSIAD